MQISILHVDILEHTCNYVRVYNILVRQLPHQWEAETKENTHTHT